MKYIINQDSLNYLRVKNRSNKSITSLSDKQHDALSILTIIRHRLHIFSDCCLLKNDSSLYYKQLKNLSLLPVMLHTAGLPELSFDRKIAELHNFLDLARRNDITSECFTILMDRVNVIREEINIDIEDYLRMVDLEHGTSYCPSGVARDRYMMNRAAEISEPAA